jgi:S1-C subfamily serine protease
MRKKIGVTGVILLSIGISANAQTSSILHLSHDATVHIVSQEGNSSGSGFLVGDQLVLTCMHVVATGQRDNQGIVQGRVFNDLQVTTAGGEVIPADVVSIPTKADSTPLQYDFAFLRLRHKPSRPFKKLSFASDNELNAVDLGDDVVFSGFPLAAPGMLTHKGMISGVDPNRSIFAVEGSVNKGNSGGALINRDGRIIGIVSMREGGITQGLAQLRNQLNATANTGMQVQFLGMNPITTTAMLIDTIDQYISVGIGYALSARYSSAYLKKRPDLLQ